MGFKGYFLFYKAVITSIPNWMLDLECKLLSVVVRWVPELTHTCILFMLDISVKIKWTMKLTLEKYSIKVFILCECLMDFCMYRSYDIWQVQVCDKYSDVDVWEDGHVCNAWKYLCVCLVYVNGSKRKVFIGVNAWKVCQISLYLFTVMESKRVRQD